VTGFVSKPFNGSFQSPLLDAADQAVIITDAQRTIVYWNAAAERLYGWTAEERLGRNLLGGAAAAAGPATEILAGVERGAPWAGEFPVPHKDGDIIPAFITMAPLPGRGGRLDGVLGISFDLSRNQATHTARAALAASLARRVVEAHARRVRPAGVSSERFARDGAVMLAMVATATLVRAALGSLAPDVAPFGAYYLAVLAAALLGGWRLGAVAVVLCVMLDRYLFIVPVHSLAMPGRAGTVGLLVFLVAATGMVAGAEYTRRLVSRLQSSRRDLAERTVNYDALFRAMSEGFALCEAIWDQDGRLSDYTVLELNPTLSRMLGVGGEAIGSKLSDTTDDRAGWLSICDRVLKTGTPESFEFHNPATGRWHEIHINRVTESRIGQLFFDITERKTAEIRQGELFDELNHRVKNNLMLVAGVLQMQARGAAPAARDQLLKAVDRVHSIAQVHAALYHGSQRHEVDFGAYLQDLCASLSQSLISDDRVTLQVETEPAILSIDTAIPLGMVVNELVTNAVKYAYPKPASGLIAVRLGRRPGALVLAVGDNGQGLPGDIEGRSGSLGMKLINSLVSQVGGNLKISHHPGATFEITLPDAT
jgi:PAS domain S-box-containing protein